METCPIDRRAGYPGPVAEAERVRDLAQDAIVRADAARTGLEELLDAVERLRGALSNGTAAAAAAAVAATPGVTLDEARLIALELAVAGRSREEVERHLRASYAGPDTAAVLADVFGV
jgi:hypothetical protein